MLHRFRVWLAEWLLGRILHWIIPKKSPEGMAWAVLSLDYLKRLGRKTPPGNWFGYVDAERLHCSKCGKVVSSPIEDGTIVRAWIECPECCQQRGND